MTLKQIQQELIELKKEVKIIDDFGFFSNCLPTEIQETVDNLTKNLDNLIYDIEMAILTK
jgi:hypothetical protein